MLADYGIPTARTSAAADLDGVLGAAERIGYPVALKTATASHKTEVNGVVLGLEDDDALSVPTRDGRRLGPAATVQEMVEPGVEMALGVVRDPQFGPLVMVAAGGVLIETLRDRALALPPWTRRAPAGSSTGSRPGRCWTASGAARRRTWSRSPGRWRAFRCWLRTSGTLSAPSTSTRSSSARGLRCGRRPGRALWRRVCAASGSRAPFEKRLVPEIRLPGSARRAHLATTRTYWTAWDARPGVCVIRPSRYPRATIATNLPTVDSSGESGP